MRMTVAPTRAARVLEGALDLPAEAPSFAAGDSWLVCRSAASAYARRRIDAQRPRMAVRRAAGPLASAVGSSV
jgi:hypothetical protein